MEILEKFLKINDGSGSGSGDGYGSGYGSGYGDGSGSGDGYGSGYGSGYGDGSGSGDGIKSFNGMRVYLIDDMQTIITSIYKNIAKGYIVNSDFTLEKCYIAKGNNKFAHGKTIEEARRNLEEKILKSLNTEEAIKKFIRKFNNKDKYKGTEFYVWHNILTGSCKMGRDSFVINNNINLNKKFSVKEFIKICENSYGGEIIRRLKKYYK